MKETLKKLFKKVEKTKKKQQKDTAKRNIWAGLLFLFIGGSMAFFSAILLWERVLTSPDLEKVLPENGLIFFANVENLQGLQTLDTENEWWNQQYKTWLNTLLGVDLDQSVRWRGDRGAIAWYDLSSGVEQNTLALVSFVAIDQVPETRQFLLDRRPESQEQFQKKYTIYSYLSPRQQFCAVFSGYLTCSEQKFLLEYILENRNGSELKLAQSEDFKRTVAELPRSHAVRFFGRAEPLFYALSDFPAERSFLPLAKTIAAVGGTLEENTRTKHLELNMLFLHNKLSPEKDLSNETISFLQNRPALLSFLPTDTTSFVWGNDLQEDFLHGFRYFQEIDPAFEVTARGLLRQYVADLFDGEISWELDILPLLEGEFVLGSTPEGMFLVLKTGDTEFATAKREKMQKGLVKMSAKFVPKIVSNTLSDGTVVQEMFPNEDAVVTEKVDTKTGTVFTIETKDGDGNVAVSIGLGQQGDVLLIGTPKEKVEALLDRPATPEIIKNFPLKFAGPSEEVFAFTSGFTYLQRYFGIAEDKMLKFLRGTGKVTTTPLYLRVMVGVEL